MKIVYAVHHLPPRYTGGAENRARRTARWFQSHGHATVAICVEAIDCGEPPCADSVDDGVFTRRLFFDRSAASDPARWEYDNPLIGQRIAELLAEQRPDVFHLISGYLMTASAIRAAHAAGVPIVITLTDFWFLCPRITLLRSDGSLCPAPPADPLGCVRCMAEEQRRFRLPAQAMPALAPSAWRMMRPIVPAIKARARSIEARRSTLSAALALASFLICPSHFLRARFIESGVAPDRLIPMRQGLGIPSRLPPRRSNGLRPVIGYSGQIKAHKGVDLLIDAASALAARGYRFTMAIYGNQDEEPAYTHSLKQRIGNADWIEWRGTYGADQVWDVLAGLDALVVPSRWYENSPNVILEAHVMGVPVIAANLGGMAELVHHDSDGLLFNVNDAHDLARQLARVLDEPSLLNRLCANAPPVKTLDQEMAEVHDVYQRAIEPRQ